MIDETLTSGGGRLLRSNLLQPSADQEIINQRLDAVEELLENPQVSSLVSSSSCEMWSSTNLLGINFIYFVCDSCCGPFDCS